MDKFHLRPGHVALRGGRLLLNAKSPGFPGSYFVDPRKLIGYIAYGAI